MATLGADWDEFLDALSRGRNFSHAGGAPELKPEKRVRATIAKRREVEISAEAIEKLYGPARSSGSNSEPAAPDVNHTLVYWAQVNASHDKLADEWADMILDPLNALTHSALFDMSEQRTIDFVEAYGRIQEQRGIYGNVCPSEDRVEKYADLVREARRCWDVALDYAERRGYNWLPPKEQKKARLADKALKLANDDRAGLPERAAAAERAAKLLKEIYSIKLPAEIHLGLEAVSRLALNAAS